MAADHRPVGLLPRARLTAALAAVAALGGVERALRLRHHWLLDGAGS
ncbi:hypothetical protein [Nocardiopsis xinjiangensis]|nr:hypothetical protein [Nocardiopsis xinjiangensis]